jgi:DNA-binding NarL/FixJ family response regulator
MIQQFIVPSLTALFTSSAALAAFYLREYSALKKQVQELAADGANGASGKLAEMTKQLESFHSRVDELEKRRNVQFDTPAAQASAPINPNRRGQIMRLHRSGESISAIASALGVSQGEVKLMVKVQELLSENGGGERSSDFL